MAIEGRNREAIMGSVTWEEESGLIRFLSTIHEEVKQFDEALDLGVKMIQKQPENIDGNTGLLKHLGFVVVRNNSALTGRDYCLYCLLKGKALHGFIGIYTDDAITTVRELGAVADYKNASDSMLGWLQALVKASCEKI